MSRVLKIFVVKNSLFMVQVSMFSVFSPVIIIPFHDFPGSAGPERAANENLSYIYQIYKVEP